MSRNTRWIDRRFNGRVRNADSLLEPSRRLLRVLPVAILENPPTEAPSAGHGPVAGIAETLRVEA